MNTLEILLIVLIAVMIIGFMILFLYLIKNNNKDNSKDVELKINKEFRSFADQLNSQLNSFNNLTNQKLVQIESDLNKNIVDTNKTTNDTFNKINERMIKIDESQKSLNELSNDIINLKSILQDKKSRGTFGEVELYYLLESAYGLPGKFYDVQYQLPNDKKADAVIFGPESLGIICVDSKFPLENYRRIYDNELPQVDREKARTTFKNDVIKHINDIKDKYIIEGVTAPMAYMFIPAEAVFSEIYANYNDLVEKSFESKVYIVSPTTLMAYITAIKSIYLGQKKDEKAKEIAKLLSELSIEFSRLKNRNEQLQRDFEKIIPDFEQIMTTSNKIIKRFAAINAGEIDDEQETD